MPPSSRGKVTKGGDKDKIPIDTLQQLAEELKAFKAALSVKETEHTWEAIERAVTRFTAVTRGGGYRFEHEYIAGLKDRDLARAIVNSLATERTQLSAATLLFLSAATRLGPSFAPLLFLYLPQIIRLLSRTNKLYVSRSTACLIAVIRNTRLAGVIPYLREGMLEKAASHRKGCLQGLLCALGGPDNITKTSMDHFEGFLVDKELVRRKYLDDVETCIKVGSRDRDLESRKIAKTCWEIYRVEFPERVQVFAAPLTPITRKYLELPPAGQPVPAYSIIASHTGKHGQENHAVFAAPSVHPPPRPNINVMPLSASHPAPQLPRAPSPHKISKSGLSQSTSQADRPSLLEHEAMGMTQNTVAAPRRAIRAGLVAGQDVTIPQYTAPPTHMARRVLPSGLSTHTVSDARPVPLTRSLTTPAAWTETQPTSVLSRLAHGISAQPILQSARIATSENAVSIKAWSDSVEPQSNHEILPERPVSACSYTSSTSSLPLSSTSPAKEPFKPSSMTTSTSISTHTAPTPLVTAPDDLQGLQNAGPQQHMQRRAVPSQASRQAGRPVRRASRVLPPSSDLQAMLASSYQPVITAQPSSSIVIPNSESVAASLKRPASALSLASSTSASRTGSTTELKASEISSEPSINAMKEVPDSTHRSPIIATSEISPNEHYIDHISNTQGSLPSTNPAEDREDDTIKISSMRPIEVEVLQKLPDAGQDASTPLKSSLEASPVRDQSTAPEGINTFPELTNEVNVLSMSAPPSTAVFSPMLSPSLLRPPVQPLFDLQSQQNVCEAGASRSAQETASTPAKTSVGESVKATPAPLFDLNALAKQLLQPPPAAEDRVSDMPAIFSASRRRTAFRPQRAKPLLSEVEIESARLNQQPFPSNSTTDDTVQVPVHAPNESLRSASSDTALPGASHVGTSSNLEPTPIPAPVPIPIPAPTLASSTTIPSNRRPPGKPELQGRSVSSSAAPFFGSSNRSAEVNLRATTTGRQTGRDQTRYGPPPVKRQAFSASNGPSSTHPGNTSSKGTQFKSFPTNRSTVRPAANVVSANPNVRQHTQTRPAIDAAVAAPSKAATVKPAVRQGSIFARLAAPTAASAARSRARVVSNTEDTFKKPLGVSGVPKSTRTNGTLSKKASSISLKSSHGHALPSESLSQSKPEQTVQAVKETPPATLDGTKLHRSALPPTSEVPVTADLVHNDALHNFDSHPAPANLEKPTLSSIVHTDDEIKVPTPSSDPTDSLQQMHGTVEDADTTFVRAARLPLPPTPEPEASQPDVGDLSSAHERLPEPLPPKAGVLLSQKNAEEPELVLPPAKADRAMTITSEEPQQPSTAPMPDPLPATQSTSERLQEEETILEDPLTDDQTAIIHDLEDLDETDVSVQAIPKLLDSTTQHKVHTKAILQDSVETPIAPTSARSVDNAENSSNFDNTLDDKATESLTPKKASHTANHTSPMILPSTTPSTVTKDCTTGSRHSVLSRDAARSHETDSVQDEPLQSIHDIQGADPSDSLFVSPTRSMRELLEHATNAAESLDRKNRSFNAASYHQNSEGQIDRGISLLTDEQEYALDTGEGTYQYDETILDGTLLDHNEGKADPLQKSGITPQISAAPITRPDHFVEAIDSKPESAKVNIVELDQEDPCSTRDKAQEEDTVEEEADQEDDFALMISRELSDDSLDELASRWEESRLVSGLYGNGGQTLNIEEEDDDDIENTPVRPRLLTRLYDDSDGGDNHNEDDNDKEEDALNVLLEMGRGKMKYTSSKGNSGVSDWRGILSEGGL